MLVNFKSSDVDFDKQRLRVHYMLIVKIKKEWTRNSFTKTNDGKRMISLDIDTINVLRKWREAQKKIGLGHENDFICSYDDLPMLKSTISRIIKSYAKLAHVKPIQAKGLRHSHASFLINELNVSVLILSKRLGHSSPEITLKHYSHLWDGADEVITNEMAGIINVSFPSSSLVHFNGNQAISK